MGAAATNTSVMVGHTLQKSLRVCPGQGCQAGTSGLQSALRGTCAARIRTQPSLLHGMAVTDCHSAVTMIHTAVKCRDARGRRVTEHRKKKRRRRGTISTLLLHSSHLSWLSPPDQATANCTQAQQSFLSRNVDFADWRGNAAGGASTCPPCWSNTRYRCSRPCLCSRAVSAVGRQCVGWTHSPSIGHSVWQDLVGSE